MTEQIEDLTRMTRLEESLPNSGSYRGIENLIVTAVMCHAKGRTDAIQGLAKVGRRTK
jgi:hypothetical protein